MSVSSITASAPVTLSSLPAPSTPAVPPDSDADDATEAQPPVVAPLPPGQGTRIDQIV